MPKKKILFVCLGNICRSPLAEGIAQSIVEDKNLKLKVDSAGTSHWHKGEAPCANSMTIAKKNHADISKQKSRPITQIDKEKFDYVIAMDKQNKKDLEAFGFQKVSLLGEYGNYHGEDVPDPYYFSGLQGFEKVYEMIEVCVNDFLRAEGLL